jgi:hypothetical protein
VISLESTHTETLVIAHRKLTSTLVADLHLQFRKHGPGFVESKARSAVIVPLGGIPVTTHDFGIIDEENSRLVRGHGALLLLFLQASEILQRSAY